MGSLNRLIANLSESADRKNLSVLSEFTKGNIIAFREDNSDAPIEPVKKSKWTNSVNEDGIPFLQREYEFEDFRSLHYFVNESLKYQEKVNHHTLMKISHRTVEIETYTLDVNDVTEIDLKIAKYFDELYEDTQYFKTGKI